MPMLVHTKCSLEYKMQNWSRLYADTFLSMVVTLLKKKKKKEKEKEFREYGIIIARTSKDIFLYL